MSILAALATVERTAELGYVKSEALRQALREAWSRAFPDYDIEKVFFRCVYTFGMGALIYGGVFLYGAIRSIAQIASRSIIPEDIISDFESMIAEEWAKPPEERRFTDAELRAFEWQAQNAKTISWSSVITDVATFAFSPAYYAYIQIKKGWDALSYVTGGHASPQIWDLVDEAVDFVMSDKYWMGVIGVCGWWIFSEYRAFKRRKELVNIL